MPKGNRPDYVIRHKDGDYWHTIGAARKTQNGEGVSLKFNMIPVGWNGQCVLVVPRDDE